MTTSESSDPIDVYVGHRIRLRRKLLRMSQKDLAAKLNMSYQQVQKYESGANRVSASVLHRTANNLGVSILYFFEGAPQETAGVRPRVDMEDPMGKPFAVEMLREFNRIANPKVRGALVDLVRNIAVNDPRAPGDKATKPQH